MQVINLYGGPGTGKSTIMAELFSKLKWAGYNVEMAPEFAKELVWESRHHTLNDQVYIFGKQSHRLHRLRDQVDYIITDSPLLLSLYYNKTSGNTFNQLVEEVYRSYDNVDIFLERTKPYQAAGRLQTESEAKVIDGALFEIVNNQCNRFSSIAADRFAADQIMTILMKHDRTCCMCDAKASLEILAENGEGSEMIYCCHGCLDQILENDSYDNLIVKSYPA